MVLSPWIEKVVYDNGQSHWNINKDLVHIGVIRLDLLQRSGSYSFGPSWFVALDRNSLCRNGVVCIVALVSSVAY